MIGPLDAIKIAAGAVLGALAVSAHTSLISLPAAREEGRSRLVSEQAAADRKSEIERKGDDAKLRNMSDFDLCVDGLRSRRLPIDACDQLRGLQPE